MSIIRKKKLLNKVGKRFASLRQNSSQTFTEISKATKLSVYKLKKLEAGKYDIWLDELFELCAYYKIRPTDVI
jgi:transcriptional regulator with XRE-family HTH domain